MLWDTHPHLIPGGAGGYSQCCATTTMQYDTGGADGMKGTTYASYMVTHHPKYQSGMRISGWFDGHETFVGSIGGKTGTFVLRASGTIRKGKVEGQWKVIEGTGRGELVGIRGGGWYEYHIDDARSGGQGKGALTVEFDDD